ncbi:MAG: DUF3592 domain-containing protein [bacterium]|nr:DUF3592 domain-containing protein [bacterium]
MDKKLRLPCIIMIIVGLLMMGGAGYFILQTIQFIRVSVTTTGVVTDIQSYRGNDDTTYSSIVTFAPKRGEEITFTQSSSSSWIPYNIGDTVPVRYNPENPKDAEINSFTDLWMIPLILFIMGAVIFGVGDGIMAAGIRRKKIIAHLLQSGQKIQTQLVQVHKDTSLRVNNRCGFRIKSQLVKDGTVHSFESERVWFDPTLLVKKDQPITVYVDPANWKTYYMDCSFLPKEA